ncbi:hypothetical protein ACFLWM_01820 [Chloroflexota bacterium]
MQKTKVHTKYPISSVLIYNGTTIAHFVLGGLGIIYGYSFSWLGNLFGALYLVFAFAQMYILMPLKVCPNCVYYGMEDSVCISGMNVVSRRIAKKGDIKQFPNRSKGLFSHNNLYMASLIIPIAAIIPALVLNYSPFILAVLIAVVGLLIFRIFVVFKRIACVYCAAKKLCPNAQSMGIA